MSCVNVVVVRSGTAGLPAAAVRMPIAAARMKIRLYR
jgi:hypothetical protein